MPAPFGALSIFLFDKSRSPSEHGLMLFMIIERFKNNDAIRVYRRFRDRGRLAPDGLQYVSSWVDIKLACCFQLMEAADASLIDRWIANWDDIVDFEVVPVMTSKEATEKMAPLLEGRDG